MGRTTFRGSIPDITPLTSTELEAEVSEATFYKRGHFRRAVMLRIKNDGEIRGNILVDPEDLYELARLAETVATGDV